MPIDCDNNNNISCDLQHINKMDNATTTTNNPVKLINKDDNINEITNEDILMENKDNILNEYIPLLSACIFDELPLLPIYIKSTPFYIFFAKKTGDVCCSDVCKAYIDKVVEIQVKDNNTDNEEILKEIENLHKDVYKLSKRYKSLLLEGPIGNIIYNLHEHNSSLSYESVYENGDECLGMSFLIAEEFFNASAFYTIGFIEIYEKYLSKILDFKIESKKEEEENNKIQILNLNSLEPIKKYLIFRKHIKKLCDYNIKHQETEYDIKSLVDNNICADFANTFNIYCLLQELCHVLQWFKINESHI